jgi:hypothetical protein
MAKQQTAETLSPLAIVTGAIVAATGAQRTAALQNYVAGRRPQVHMAAGWATLGGVDQPPVGLDFPSSGTTTMLTFRIYIHPDVATLTLGVEATVAAGATTLRTTFRVGGATANIDATSANNGAEQTTTVAVSSTGNGWRDVEVDLTRVSGAAVGSVLYISIQDTPITTASSLPDPANS